MQYKSFRRGAFVVPLKSIDVQLTVRGFVANVVTTLQYKNTEKNAIEAEFEFPIDDHSAVYQFEAKIEDRVIIAECQEKKQVLFALVCCQNKLCGRPPKYAPCDLNL